jgi:hypothetical protein
MTLRVRGLRVRSLDILRKEVSWEVEPGADDAVDYTFCVERSASPGGPFDAVSPPFEDRYLFVDTRIPQGDQYALLYYRIATRHKATNTVSHSAVAAQEPDPDLVATYIRKHELVLFTQAIGRQVWLFKRRNFGARCRSCFDPVLNSKVRERCLDCFDTGFLRGYHNPMEVWVQIDPAPKSQQNGSLLTTQATATTARTSYFPEIIPGDLLVEAENKRWLVNGVSTSERLRAVIKQELSISLVAPTDIEYKLPINLTEALRDLQASPVRPFENATTLETAVESRVPNLFAAYLTYPKEP